MLARIPAAAARVAVLHRAAAVARAEVHVVEDVAAVVVVVEDDARA